MGRPLYWGNIVPAWTSVIESTALVQVFRGTAGVYSTARITVTTVTYLIPFLDLVTTVTHLNFKTVVRFTGYHLVWSWDTILKY